MAKPKAKDYRKNPPGRPAGYITVSRAAEIAQCHPVTIRRLIKRRGAMVVRWRERVLIRERDFTDWNRVRRYRRRSTKLELVSLEARAPLEASTDRPMEAQP